MPGRLRQSARISEVGTDARAYNISGLEYGDALSWRAGKAIAVGDLLTRLQKLGTELRNLDQGVVAATEFTRLAQDLAHSNLLGHKDKGVRAWTLCCIVDILNICAPDAPFGPAQLKDIFTVVVNTILPALADPSNAYNAQHIYILNSLTDTKSIVLITDLENSDSLIVPLFAICFDIVSGAGQNVGGVELAKSVEFQLKSMLVTIIDEINLPQEATDTILSQFLRVDPRTSQEQISKSKKTASSKDKKQDTLHLKDYPPAYNMAKAICTTCPEKMTVHITQYFGNVIMNASASLEGTDDVKLQGRKQSEYIESDDEDESLADLRKAHRLVRELWRACPDVLQNVIPQIETELAADSTSLRQLATETLGDIISGIGISGPPPTSILDPATFPLPSIEDAEPVSLTTNPLLVPASPKPFGSIHVSAFSAFLGRQIDRSPSVRSAWAVAVSRILLTDAGGIGISAEHRSKMLSGFAQMLRDIDEKVRFTTIQTVAQFDYHRVINILGADGEDSEVSPVISALAERVSDRKPAVREEAMVTLGRMWGVASYDIQSGVERVVAVLGSIPTVLLSAMFINDAHTQTLLDKVLYESLLPLHFPPNRTSKGESQKQRSKNQSSQAQDVSTSDADHVRVKRFLTMFKSLSPRARPVFLGMQKRQVEMSKGINVFLKACEDYNGGVIDDDSDESRLKESLSRYINGLSRQYPDPSRVAKDLWKFAEMHDRRSYQLIRYATGTEHDYRTMTKATKELTKRIREGPSNSQALMETLQPILYRCALIVYNRSHVPSVMEISRSDESGLGEVAHEILKDISSRNPEVLKSHIQALCKELEAEAPSSSKLETGSAADTLKACAGFARKYPADVPKDRKFLAALSNYALFSHSPRAAKHATTIVLTVSDRKELHAKELLTKAINDCKSSSPQYLARLATIAQVCLLKPGAAVAEEESILNIAVTECLQKNEMPDSTKDPNAWEPLASNETAAKELALKIMVNRCRSTDEKASLEDFDTLAGNVLALLMRLLDDAGDLAPSQDTPPAQRNQLRLIAARFILKLCCHKRRCEELVTPTMFNTVALIVINPPNPVRIGFIQQLQKYLGRLQLAQRWYTVFFLLAFEPDVKLRSDALAWLKSRVQFFARQQKQASSAGITKPANQNILETVFARLLSLLAHHPDYPPANDPDFDGNLLDFSRYLIFYLQAVATEENLSLIFHIAQRVKQTKDNIDGTEATSQQLYVLSDLAQAVIRNYADQMPAHAKGVNLLQIWPGRVSLPSHLFSALPNHTIAQEIAAKNFLPEDVALGLERLVKNVVKGVKGKTKAPTSERKRKTSDSVDLDDDDDVDERRRSVKKPKKTSLAIRRTPKAQRKAHDGSMSIEQPSRKSARTSTAAAVNYVESDDDEDEDENMYDAPAASSPITKARASRRSAENNKLASQMISADEAAEESATGETGNDSEGEANTTAQPGHQDVDSEKENESLEQGSNEGASADGLDDTTEETSNDEAPPEEVDALTPLKEKTNGRTAKTRTRNNANTQSRPSARAKGKGTAAPTTKPKKAKDIPKESPATTRRSTRGQKA